MIIVTEEYHGIKRNRIPWYPSIDNKKCINCRICVEYCKLGVYIIEKDEHPLVKNPNNCIVFCTGCKGKNPVEALSFPSKQKIRELINKLES